MSKIRQALEQARTNRKKNQNLEEIPAGRIDPPAAETVFKQGQDVRPLKSFAPTIPLLEAENEMTSLYQNIEVLLGHATKKIIQFIGSQPGEGTSSVAWNFAGFTASRLGKKVLLLEGDSAEPYQTSAWANVVSFSLEEVVRQGQGVEKALACSKDSGLTVCRIAEKGSLIRFLESESQPLLWQDLKDAFDLIVIDFPPLSSSSAGLAFCRQADGVVLVLEADRTRGPIAENTRDQILKNGGNILGVAFNKRQFYIPKAIYQRL